jgi:hypothetical protein
VLKHWAKKYPEDFDEVMEKMLRESLSSYPPATWSRVQLHKNMPDVGESLFSSLLCVVQLLTAAVSDYRCS